MFDSAATDVENELVKVSSGGLTYFAEYKYGRLEHKMDHLACFAGNAKNPRSTDRFSFVTFSRKNPIWVWDMMKHNR